MANASLRKTNYSKKWQTWIIFPGEGDGTPTVRIQLTTQLDFFTVQIEGVVAINTRITQGNCSCYTIFDIQKFINELSNIAHHSGKWHTDRCYQSPR